MGIGFVTFRQNHRGRGFSLLAFYSSLSTLRMFESIKAVRGCLIGPKTWDRIVRNFFRNFLLSVTVHIAWGMKSYNYMINHALIEIGPGMA